MEDHRATAANPPKYPDHNFKTRYWYNTLDQVSRDSTPDRGNASDSVHYEIYEGWKRYEITNHLGNVLAVITDRKRGLASSDSTIQWYEADVLTAQQYYPFGMPMPDHATDAGRRRQYSLNGADYRYGFNGKEGDDEVKGDDNQQNYGMRIYDPRVGRFLSVDPLVRDYPWYSPYHFAGNMPISSLDLDGLEPRTMITNMGKLTSPVLALLKSTFAYDENYMKLSTWDDYKKSRWGRFWFKVTQKPTASVLNRSVFYDKDYTDIYFTDAKWLSLVVHEEFHRQEVELMGKWAFYIDYITEGSATEYRNIHTEKVAYVFESYMDMLVKQNRNVIDIINSSAMTDKEKSTHLSLIGKTFRAAYVLPDLINKTENEIQRLQIELSKNGADKNFIQSWIDYHTEQKNIFQQEMNKLNFELDAPSIPNDKI